MFIIGFLEKSFQILWSFLRFSGAVIFLSDSQKNRLSDTLARHIPYL